MIGLYTAIADRLRVNCPALLQVETGMDALAALDMLALGKDVTALITPISDDADPIKESGFLVSQRETWLFGVTMALVFPGGFSEFEPARDQVKATLRGWLPEGAATPIQYAGGRTLQYSASQDGGRWLHLLRFRLTVQERIEAQS